MRGRRAVLAAVLLAVCSGGWAAGPRWVTGPPYFTGAWGQPVVWYTMTPQYFTDPGDLSASVPHAQAEALVAAAASVWNVATSQITLAQGGALSEHVSGANTYLSQSGPVFPADVSSSNYAAKQIAVIYDADGSVIDMLLGGGASGPGECRQNGVVEDVDSISQAGKILHAILVLNGRCTGPAPEQQLQLQYQLERAFGRVLGLGWSQTNDTMFTRASTPTPNQAMHWPVMHPIDVICGQYTYQCMPQPFVLRDDDVASISSLYPFYWFYSVPTTAPAPGKAWTFVQASQMYGAVSFPSGQGMQGVNVLVQRQQGGWPIPEDWFDVSAVSGYLYQREAGNPVTGAGTDWLSSMGTTDPGYEGFFQFGWIPDIDPIGAPHGPMSVNVTTEPINPLYTGNYAVGPYVSGAVVPSGAAVQAAASALQPYLYPWSSVPMYTTPQGAAGQCGGSGGTQSSPAGLATSGWWTGGLCARAQASWSSASMRGGRTATVEVTALDQQGLATTAKGMPLIGVWNATDSTGSAPTVAATGSSFNTTTLGMTAVTLDLPRPAGTADPAPQSYLLGVTDARGDARPDFNFQARLLYADTVQPAATSVNGGQIVVSGTGFRAGNEVLVNGLPVAVSSWTANRIVAVAPAVTAFAGAPAGPVDVAVVDLSTGGRTVVSGALTYGGVAPDQMLSVSSPVGPVLVGTAAGPFAVRVVLADGVTPVAGLPVTFTAGGGAVQFAECAAAPCVVLTDAAGLAAATATPGAFGTVTLNASAVGASVSASFLAVARSVTAVRAVEYVAAGATVAWSPAVSLIENGAGAAGVAVAWSASTGIVMAAVSSTADASGVAQVAALWGPLRANAQAASQACAWAGSATGSLCAQVAAIGVDPSAFQLAVVSGAGQTVAGGAAFAPVAVQVTDGAGHPVAGAPVTVHQAVDLSEAACPQKGRCAAVPVVGQVQAIAVSDADGLVTVTPMQVPGVAAVTNVAVASGTQGFASLSLVAGP